MKQYQATCFPKCDHTPCPLQKKPRLKMMFVCLIELKLYKVIEMFIFISL